MNELDRLKNKIRQCDAAILEALLERNKGIEEIIAMEASERLPEDQRLITVKAERVRDMLIITVENNTLPGTQPAKGTTKKDRFVHGFGIPNIKKAVEKYDGQCSFRQEDGTYLLKILIPIP